MTVRNSSSRHALNSRSQFNSFQSHLSMREILTKNWTEEIRFYLYPLESFPSFWGPQSSCDYSKILTPKHDGYIYAIQAMKRHPWRTSNPHEAMIAILPLSLDVYSRGGCPGLGRLFSGCITLHVGNAVNMKKKLLIVVLAPVGDTGNSDIFSSSHESTIQSDWINRKVKKWPKEVVEYGTQYH